MSVKFEDFTIVVKDITGGNKKYVSSEYLNAGKYPIIDQGEKFIGGYINDEEIVKRDKDIVIFGDHTKVLKYVDFDFCLGADGVKVLQPNDELTSKFLYYFLHTIELPNVGYSRHFKFLKETKIPLPPLETQKAIAEKLDKADALRKKDQELLKQYDELAQSIFIDMFGDPVQNEKEWEIKFIQDLVSKDKNSLKRGPFGGALKKEIFVEEGYLVYEQYHALNNDFTMERYFIDDKKFKELESFSVKPKDIIISCSGVYLGKLAIIPDNAKEGIINQALLKLTLNENVMTNDFFVFHFIQPNFKTKYFDSNRGAGIPNFPPMSEFKQFPFITPPLELQNQFAEKIKNIEAQKELVKKQAEESENLFQALLQESFNFS